MCTILALMLSLSKHEATFTVISKGYRFPVRFPFPIDKEVKMRIVRSMILLTVIVSVSVSLAEMKVGIVNSKVIFDKYEGLKEAQEKLKKEEAKWDQNISNRYKEIRALKEQLRQQSLLMSEERKKKLQDSIANMEALTFQEEQKKYGKTGEGNDKNIELSKQIVDKVNGVIEKIAKEENFDMIFDVQAGGIVYALPKYDITERVIMLLNKEK
jgi:outer membrane protein